MDRYTHIALESVIEAIGRLPDLHVEKAEAMRTVTDNVEIPSEKWPGKWTNARDNCVENSQQLATKRNSTIHTVFKKIPCNSMTCKGLHIGVPTEIRTPAASLKS